jgi:glycosyltransferase involved in cell wall biosynthesis
VRRANHVIAVSQKLAEYLIGRYRLPPEKISVVPCCADETTFKWDTARRDAVRREMNLSNKLVCTHLGSFFEWYDPAMITNVFQQIRTRADSHLLVITAESEKTQAYLSARLPANTFAVRRAARDEVPGLLNASDLGFLLLRCSSNIKTSSPVKFAEYLNCGLPVLITPDVGDFSELVAQEKVGAIVDGARGTFEASVLNRAIDDRLQLGARCMAVGRQLTWQAYSPMWSKVVSSI